MLALHESKIKVAIFFINGMLPLKAILSSQFMCVYITIIPTILAEILWNMDSAVALKCISYGLESWLAGHLDKSSVHWREGSRYLNAWSNMHRKRLHSVWGGVYIGNANVAISATTNHKQKVTNNTWIYI